MPRPRPPYLHRVITRHGKAVWYVRLGVGQRKRIRLRSEFGTEDFRLEYEAALSGAPQSTPGAPASGTLAWLIERYREVSAWTTLSLATRRQRENIFKHVLESAGDKALASITTAAISLALSGGPRRQLRPRNFLDAMRGLFKWAAKAKLVKTDPTLGVENPPRKTGDGFIPWTEDDVAAYELRWPIGTRQRIWLDVLLYTGLRRGDAVRFGRQHVKDGVGTIKTEKSGFDHHRDAANPPGPGCNAGRRPLRGSDLHRRRERAAADKGVVWQPISRGLPSGRRSRLGARCPQDRCDKGGEQWRDRRPARGDLWVGRAARWLRSTRGRLIADGCRSRRWAS